MPLYVYYTKNGNESQVLFLTLYLGRQRSAVPTAKLGHSAIKFQASFPDKIKSKTLNREHVSVERTIFENSPKPFLLESFWRYLFSKR